LFPESPFETRELLARHYLRGSGIEVGAFASPLPVPAGVLVQYVDKYTLSDMSEAHTIAGLTLADFGVDLGTIIQPDIVDDGETLSKVGDYTQDFVIANHVLEHFEDPIQGFKNMMRVLKHDGILYLSLPEMRHSFDRNRQPTPVEHLIRDYEEGPAWSREQAYAEFAELFVENGMDKGLFPKHAGAARKDFERRVADELNQAQFSIHFHAWTMHGMIELFTVLKTYLRINFEFELIKKNGDEVIFLFRKVAAA
jgi:SAM-dependent methyltransferase